MEWWLERSSDYLEDLGDPLKAVRPTVEGSQDHL